jgi:hypothetical protein
MDAFARDLGAANNFGDDDGPKLGRSNTLKSAVERAYRRANGFRQYDSPFSITHYRLLTPK